MNVKDELMAKKRYSYIVWSFSVILLIASGIVYRFCVHFIGSINVKLPVSLNAFPCEIGSWTAIENNIPATIREYMESNFADDYISRRYVNRETQAWADVYFVYCGTRPGGIIGHKPTICYPSNGWIFDETKKSQFSTEKGRIIDCLLQRFHKQSSTFDKIIVLSFYIVDGQLSIDETKPSGLSGRMYNPTGDIARYIAQVQISSVSESTIRQIAEEITDMILTFFPDKNGYVRAVERFGQLSNTSK
jgi:hypothetical protein